MAKARGVSPSTSSKKIRPAITPEAREQQLIALAVDLVEQRLLDGTASSQETTHYLKLASTKAKLENEKIKLELELTKAKTDSIKSQQRSEEMFEEALRAFRGYSGQASPIEEEGDNYDEY